jgi:hypothetical protein
MTAGLMLALVLIFVVATNVYIFPHPILMSDAAMKAAVASAL